MCRVQVFVGKIPRDLYEDELVPLFEKAGPIWDLRLMMDPLSGQNRGYAFITFCGKEAAQEAVKLVSFTNYINEVLCLLGGESRIFPNALKQTHRFLSVLYMVSKWLINCCD